MSAKDAKRVAKSFRDGGTFCAHLPPWPGISAVCMEVFSQAKGNIVIVTDGPLSVDRAFGDLQTLCSNQAGKNALLAYPALESFPGHGAAPHAQLTGDRLQALVRLGQTGRRNIIVTSAQALMQRTATPEWIKENVIELSEGRDHDTTDLLTHLEKTGYAFEAEVLVPGQASWRGSILDVWPPGSESPLRIEFFGFTIESIRRFDPIEQRSIDTCVKTTLFPASERPPEGPDASTLIQHLSPSTVFIWIDHENISQHADLYERSAKEADAVQHIRSFQSLKEDISEKQAALQVFFDETPPVESDAWSFDFQPLPGIPTPANLSTPLDHVEDQRRKFISALFDRVSGGWNLHVYFQTSGGRDRFTESILQDHDTTERVFLHDGVLSESCLCEQSQNIVLSDRDLYGRHREKIDRQQVKRRKQKKKQTTGERIHSWSDIQPGDYVVHLDHGIGIYRGLFEINVRGTMQEALTVEYADKAKIYIPTGHTHLLSRYIGVGKRHPKLHAIGGKRWSREKASAERAVQDLAAQLLETQAARDAKKGHSFSKDTAWQHEFESAFPFEETPDQAQAIAEVKADMESARPMDRLVCGDVGYGKTEVAMRAAFKCVMDGKQTAILVPTTVLAQQHFDTFNERISAFPVRIEMLSRFQTKAQQMDTLDRLAKGEVDIIIGTHRLVSKDVRFKDLGLVVVDEEQRFGVKHKEHLKQMRQLVDVLTMTATPIPRTLYMSLTGAKDLSIIETAPVERLPIETVITENRDDIVREAILRELNREGQIYYLHNRVQTIEHIRNNLVQLVPEARIQIAHGQMNENELSAIMRSFTRGEFDLLLCTTIIESGLNIPNVNTILIDRADRFGLAELYQLRGRVGRYKRKAYAYLLLPKHGELFFMARQRIGAVKRYSSLGSGFKLAMRDLELRGAGNILGSEQSGHIATVGFDLYCQLLQSTVNKMKGIAPAPVIDVDLNFDFISLSPDDEPDDQAAAIPISYMEDETIRVRMYRRFASITTMREVKLLREEFTDRFGPIPESVIRLFLLAEIKLSASNAAIQRIEVSGEKVIMTRGGDYIMIDKRFPRLPMGNATERLERLLRLVQKSKNKT